MSRIKLLLAAGILGLSFMTTSYIIGRYTAHTEEQRQDDFINNKAEDSVVLIRDPKGEKGGGTGFFVNSPSGNTFILTNNHVCELASNDTLLIDDEYFATIISHSPDHDLCLVSNPLNSQGLSVADSSREGQDVYVTGYPLLEPYAAVKGQISGSMIATLMIGYNRQCSKKEREIKAEAGSLMEVFGIANICLRDYDAQALTANILPGNSGSPVLNQKGEVVGVAFAGREDGPGRGYIVPLKYVQKFLSDK